MPGIVFAPSGATNRLRTACDMSRCCAHGESPDVVSIGMRQIATGVECAVTPARRRPAFRCSTIRSEDREAYGLLVLVACVLEHCARRLSSDRMATKHVPRICCARGNLSLLEIRDLLGHSTTGVTERYAKFHLDQDLRRQQVAKIAAAFAQRCPFWIQLPHPYSKPLPQKGTVRHEW